MSVLSNFVKMKLLVIALLFLTSRVSSKCKRCFPPEFFWGATTSAYQIEGAWNVSGKGENSWDWFCHNFPEKIHNGSNGDIACDSYNKYEDDIRLLENLGVNSYRLSISWSRILPKGTIDEINADGVEYYLNIFKLLKEKNIEPVVTIYHWDLPLTLQQLGGWTNPKIADYFADYAKLCFELFGEYVTYWSTLNEPMFHCFTAYGIGIAAPGITQSGNATYMCAYTELLAHAKAYHIYNNTYRDTQNGKVGIVLVNIWMEPLTNSSEDIAAAEQALQFGIGMFANPIIHGNWPELVINRVGNLSQAQGFASSRLPALTDEEIDFIKGTMDYFSFNYYTTKYATPRENLSMIENFTVNYFIDIGITESVDSSWPHGISEWLYSVPFGLRHMLNWIKTRYNDPEIMIAENGLSDDASILEDNNRITYLQDHVCSVAKAKFLDGVNVIGYFVWSLLDNFEWAGGYMEAFGLVAVDFTSENRTRTPRSSYYWYKNVLETGCLEHCSFKKE